ncbi:hypothetical protein ACOMHN_021091 [Nucella lapillus]
MSGLSEV